MIIQIFIHRFKEIDYLQIQEYEILKYIPYVHPSCLRIIIIIIIKRKNSFKTGAHLNRSGTKYFRQNSLTEDHMEVIFSALSTSLSVDTVK